MQYQYTILSFGVKLEAAIAASSLTPKLKILAIDHLEYVHGTR